MARSAKVLLIGTGLIVALVFSAALVAGIVVHRVIHAGTAIVSVHEKRPDGVRLWLPVPVGLVQAALSFVPPSERPVLDPEARRWLPVARSVLHELEQAPDGVLVEVRSSDEHVVIAKRDGHLVVDVDNARESVEVSLPAGTLADVLAVVESWPETQHVPAEGHLRT